MELCDKKLIFRQKPLFLASILASTFYYISFITKYRWELNPAVFLHIFEIQRSIKDKRNRNVAGARLQKSRKFNASLCEVILLFIFDKKKIIFVLKTIVGRYIIY